MAELSQPWLTAMFGAIGIAIGIAFLRIGDNGRRLLGRAAAVAALIAAIGAGAEAYGSSGLLADPWDPVRALTGHPLLVVDELSALLLPFAAALWLAVFGIAPRAKFMAPRLRRLLAAEIAVLGMFACRDPIALAVLWAMSIALFVIDHRASDRRGYRLGAGYLGASAILFAGGVALIEAGFADWGVGLVAVAVMIRKGIFPGHSWMPELFDRGNLAPAILFSAPQVGAYAALVVVMPAAPRWMLTAIGALSLATAVYGAAASLVQTRPRRAFGFLFMSQSALVMVGLDGTSLVGVTGSLCLWLTTGLALAGFGMTVWVLEARRGPLSLTRLNGGHDSVPVLASSFLVLGLASVGFPGTLGFVGEELLIDGAVSAFPHIGFAVVAAIALNAICVLRMYFSLFCGARGGGLVVRLRARELAVFAGMTAILLAGGFAPAPIVESRMRAADIAMRSGQQSGNFPRRSEHSSPTPGRKEHDPAATNAGGNDE